MTDADIIEDQIDHLIYHLECFIMSHVDIEPEKLETIREFVEWCVQDDKEALDAPRGRDGKSYRQKRDDIRDKEDKFP